MIIDTHAHIFTERQGRMAHTPEKFLSQMDKIGVERAVLLQGPYYGECNGYVESAVKRYPQRFAGAAYFDPWKESRHDFDGIVHEGALVALKLEMSEPTGLSGIHPQASLADLSLAWLWGKLESLMMVLVLDLGGIGSRSYQTDAVRAIAEGHPSLKITIAHLAQPSPSIETDYLLRQHWLDQIDLGLIPNIWFDTASLPAYAFGEEYPWPSAARFLKSAVERIGSHKIMWGSDIPGLLKWGAYSQLLSATAESLSFLPESERKRVMGENAWHVFWEGRV